MSFYINQKIFYSPTFYTALMDIEKEILSRITPSDQENRHLMAVVDRVKEKVLDLARSLNIEVEPVLVGSVAKDTHLTDPDIDIFVMFAPNTKREDLELYGLKIGEGILGESERRYAEHPYVSGKFHGMKVEIVPCYKIEDPSQKMSAVDRTPFHTRYIIEHQKEEHKNQIRVLKGFLQGIGIYGAESEIEGFSGYLCELLVLHYGNFENLIAHAKDWKKGELITYDDREHAKFNDCLIVVDPVDPNRNVASALSQENFALFVHACKEYHLEPRIEFFYPKDIIPESIDDLKEAMKGRESTLLGITFETPDTISDVLHSQLRKSLKAISKLCERYGFRIIDSGFFVNHDVMLLFEFEVFSLPSVKQHKGPPVWHPNSSDFLGK